MMDFQYGWLLNLICYLPLAGALLMMAFINKENSTGIKTWATLVAGLDFVISIPLWFLYKPGGVEFQFATQFEQQPFQFTFLGQYLQVHLGQLDAGFQCAALGV